jgi:hypothetical protein
VVEGVGPVDGSLSHFEMAARWETGDAASVLPTAPEVLPIVAA